MAARKNHPTPDGMCSFCWLGRPRKRSSAFQSFTLGYPSTLPPDQRRAIGLCSACIAQLRAEGGWQLIPAGPPPIDADAFLAAVYGNDLPAMHERNGEDVTMDADYRDSRDEGEEWKRGSK